MARKKKNNKIVSTVLLVIILVVFSIINQNGKIQSYIEKVTDSQENTINASVKESENGIKKIVIGSGNPDDKDNLKVYYIDVGQADSILIMNGEESTLIDAGNNEDGEDVVDFIKERGITKLNYVIGTHPHEDHIGGLDDVINNIEIDKIYLPKIQTTTNTYEDVLKAIENKSKTINSFKKEDIFTIGKAKAEVMTDSILDKNNLNLSSNIIRLKYNNVSFLFTGDAEKDNEKNIKWPQTDILKVRTSWFEN